MHTESLSLMKWILSSTGIPKVKGARVADVGSYDVNGSYRNTMTKMGVRSYTGIDISSGPNVDIVVDPEAESWSDVGQFDLVISGQCMEHVRRPWEWIKRVIELMNDDACLVIVAPHTWRYHEYPIDCWRVFPEGMKALFDDNGLHSLALGMVMYPTGYGDTFGVASKQPIARKIEGKKASFSIWRQLRLMDLG